MSFFSKQMWDSLMYALSYVEEEERVGVVGKITLIVLATIIVFFIPSIIALIRKHQNGVAIIVLNAIPFFTWGLMILGDTMLVSNEYASGYAFLVWAVALIWAVIKPLTIRIQISNTSAGKNSDSVCEDEEEITEKLKKVFEEKNS